MNQPVVLITGISSGIGRATALELAREGCDIIAAARTAEQLADLAEEIRRKYNRRVTTDAADWVNQFPDGELRDTAMECLAQATVGKK